MSRLSKPRTVGWPYVAALLGMTMLLACGPRPTRDLVLPNGRTVSLFGVGSAVGPLGMVDRTRARDTVFIVRYRAADDQAQRAAERDDLLAWAGPLATRAGVRYIGLERAEYPYGRLVPWVQRGLAFYERRADGTWARFKKA
jgi:hypothetical protein